MKSTLRRSRKEILAIGNIFAFDVEGDAGDGQDGTAGGTEQDADTSTEADSGSGTANDGDDDDEDPAKLKKKLQNRREQAERQDAEIKRLKAKADKADELQGKVDEAERAKRSELENAKADLEAKDKVIAAKDDTIRRLTVENAFMTLKELEWHDPATALKLVDLSEVEFDEETGKVKDRKLLLTAAKALAKDKPFLVRSETDVDKGTPNPRTSGKPPAGKKPGTPNEDAIRSKYNIHK